MQLTYYIVSKLDTRLAQNLTKEQANTLSDDVLKKSSSHQEN